MAPADNCPDADAKGACMVSFLGVSKLGSIFS
jgi:hypothetical protein